MGKKRTVQDKKENQTKAQHGYQTKGGEMFVNVKAVKQIKILLINVPIIVTWSAGRDRTSSIRFCFSEFDSSVIGLVP